MELFNKVWDGSIIKPDDFEVMQFCLLNLINDKEGIFEKMTGRSIDEVLNSTVAKYERHKWTENSLLWDYLYIHDPYDYQVGDPNYFNDFTIKEAYYELIDSKGDWYALCNYADSEVTEEISRCFKDVLPKNKVEELYDRGYLYR